MDRIKTLFGAAVVTMTMAACGEAEEPLDEELAAWEQAAEEQQSGKADDNRCSGVLVPDRSGFNKRVALTFDDGPNLQTTPDILATLAEHDIKATFFINGKRVTSEAHRQLLRDMVDAGHILANHTQSHQQMTKLSAGNVDKQIRQTHEIIADVVTPKYFRFPFGASNCSTADAVRSFDLIVTGWHVDSADWCFASAKGGVGHCHPGTFKFVPDNMRDDMVAFTMDQTRAKGGGILLFHDIHANTAANVGPIVEQLKAEGFTFTNIDDTGAFPVLNGETDDSLFVGDPCMDDAECEFTNKGNKAECLEFGDDGFCTVECDGFCPDKFGASETFCVSLDDGSSGSCVAKAGSANSDCSDIPGTVRSESVQRFIGSSSAKAATATVCLPSLSEGPSCMGMCGGTSPAPGSDPSCFCEVGCRQNGDCCPDFESVCN